MRFVCTAIILLCAVVNNLSVWEFCFPVALGLFIDCYSIIIGQCLILSLYTFLLLCYVVSWAQKLL